MSDDNDSLIVLAIDPGGTTGTCSIRWDGDPTHIPHPEALIYSEQVAFDDMPRWLDDELAAIRPYLIVYERFQISPRTVQYSRQPEALYVIGGVLFAAKLAGIPVREQGAADAKNAYPNDRIKDWKVKGPHAKDALRHALLSCHRRL